MHIVALFVFCDILKQFFQQFDIISFGIMLPDIVENSIFDIMGAKSDRCSSSTQGGRS